ncbi:UTRA domain-containing protein [Sneathiella sp. P13V-1]|uniref:UTRA domain-containing protein n=1 Tax=Sneathiella sp. P13V-1 TaxID=2697366 RepID=UPI00187B4C28|nr:UTRA domain-containing protein [Sneathiella sp. P13V-1]MBE7636272.1 UTRA domain-containing protein [Sneathiella sp. P13V-1]
MNTMEITSLSVDRRPQPLYQQVKSYVLDHIQRGSWPVHSKIPSEHTLVRDLGMSRMTIHRALRELTQEGVLTRIQGVGTYIAKPEVHETHLILPSIESYITLRGNSYSKSVLFHQKDPLDTEQAILLGLKEGSEAYRSYVVHKENGVPVLLEDRYVVPHVVPDYIDQDFTTMSSEVFLEARCSLLSHKYQLSVQISDQEIHHFMELDHPTPCLCIGKRTWTGNQLLSTARLLYPGNRIQFNC